MSADGTFELGFFSPVGSTKRYLGIWYRVVLTVAWVANRETSLSDHSGVLSVTKQGIVTLTDGKNGIIWSANSSKIVKNPILQLLETGNLILKDGDGNSNILWQSFDYPTDTLLSGMKLGRNFRTGFDKYLTSWKSASDPAPGEFSLRIDPHGFPQLVIRNGSEFYYRVGSWNGIRFSGTPRLIPTLGLVYRFELNKEEVYYEVDDQGALMSRLFLDQTGFIHRFVRSKTSNRWTDIYDAPEDQCDTYSLCGVNSRCRSNNSPICACFDGFEPKSVEEWSKSNWAKGCVRKTPLKLLNCEKEVEFVSYTNLKLPDTQNSWYNTSMNSGECADLCLRNCSCTAYANSSIANGGSGCLLWFGELTDMREYDQVEQQFFIRMARKGIHITYY